MNGKSAFSEPLLIATDDPLVFITAFKGALTVAGTERIVDQLSEGAALLIGLKILADHLESFFSVLAEDYLISLTLPPRTR